MLKAARMLTLKHFFIAIIRASSTLLEPLLSKNLYIDLIQCVYLL